MEVKSTEDHAVGGRRPATNMLEAEGKSVFPESEFMEGKTSPPPRKPRLRANPIPRTPPIPVKRILQDGGLGERTSW